MRDGWSEPWARDEFLTRLTAVGRSEYHDRHPFHQAMNAGLLTPAQVRGWIANRFHYQRNIPVKDAAILTNCPHYEVRRSWVQRLLVHDGTAPGEGGIEAWLRLGQAAGMTREELLDARHVRPAVRASVDDYVRLAREEVWPVAVASSLTELFAPDLMAERVRAFESYYPWVDSQGLQYFRSRLVQARVDSKEALALTMTWCDSRALQDRAIWALGEKCRILWAMLDSIQEAYGLGPSNEGGDR